MNSFKEMPRLAYGKICTVLPLRPESVPSEVSGNRAVLRNITESKRALERKTRCELWKGCDMPEGTGKG